MRQRIVALLEERPEGMTSAQMQMALGEERSLTDTCLGMHRDGLLQRVERGWYVVAGGERHPQQGEL
jgi:predicted DNA-binding transcriptional regulator